MLSTSIHQSERTIAIFDDDEDILSICAYILKEIGWQVCTYTNCNQILAKVADCRPAVILMDNWIPDEGGIIATQTLKRTEAFRQIRVIYFSANSDISTLAQTAGADAFLAKPFDLDNLTAVIERVLH
jgi:DNA-binding NtrC family response regulator